MHFQGQHLKFLIKISIFYQKICNFKCPKSILPSANFYRFCRFFGQKNGKRQNGKNGKKTGKNGKRQTRPPLTYTHRHPAGSRSQSPSPARDRRPAGRSGTENFGPRPGLMIRRPLFIVRIYFMCVNRRGSKISSTYDHFKYGFVFIN